jgi:hypothetical protein
VIIPARGLLVRLQVGAYRHGTLNKTRFPICST